MWGRNNASPNPVLMGALVSTTDGSLATSSASARVKLGTGSWSAASGTLDCDATSGAWTYLPTQAETNTESLCVALYKTGYTPQYQQVVTSKSSTFGYAGLDWGQVLNPTTTVGLTGTTISTSQAVASVSGNVGGVAGTTTTLDALQTALNTAHGSGSWATATGFSTLDAAGVRTAVGLASANLDTQLDSLATPADVNAQVLDVLTTDTFAELSAVPAATSSLKDKLTWVFQWLRNKSTQTSTQRKLYADDGTTVVSTETISDDNTTYTKGEAS